MFKNVQIDTRRVENVSAAKAGQEGKQEKRIQYTWIPGLKGGAGPSFGEENRHQQEKRTE